MPSLLGNPTMSTKTSLFRQKRLPIIKIKASTTSSTATIDLYPQIEMETQTRPVMYDASIEAFEENELILSNNTCLLYTSDAADE